MEPEPDLVDLSAIDPSRDELRWRHAIGSVAARAIARRALRRKLLWRGAVVAVVAAAAGAMLWLSAPRRDQSQRRDTVLDLAANASPDQILELDDAQ
jgi:hypothetical protein